MPNHQKEILRQINLGNKYGAFRKSEEHKKKISLASMGKPATKGMTGKNLSALAIEKIRQAKKGKPGNNRGSRHGNWKGGITPIHQAIRKSIEYKAWRKAVFERDNYTCQKCYKSSKAGNKTILNADHIKPFSLFPELRLDINNGRTLCEPCHRKTDTYGKNIRYVQSLC